MPKLENIRLEDVASRLGLQHSYVNSEEGQALMVEATGGGCGWGDFDRDGKWDLYLNQAGDCKLPAAKDSQPTDRLFRNVGGQFVDVTESARIAEFGYSQGVAVGDYDDDGFDDIYVTNYRRNTLWRNLGDGTFEEVAEAAGVADERWSSSAAWHDLDGDGDLDLYVCNYVQYNHLVAGPCVNANGEPRVCHPREFEAWPDEWYENQGDGTFLPMAKEVGLVGEGGKGLGVAIADFNNDGRPDVYVANDTTANFLFINEGGTFREQASVLGCAANRMGSLQASMGLAIGDLDNNGWLDIYISHYFNESNTYYQCLGTAGFEDVTGREGLHFPSMPKLGFGTVAEDFDSSGYLDLFVGNGHVENFPGNPLHKMQSQVFSSEGGRWQDVSDTAGEFLQGKRVARGVSGCDFDDDGDVDLAVVHQNDPVALLENRSSHGHWLKLAFEGIENNRRGIGCRVVVRWKDHQGEQRRVHELIGGGSYAVSQQPALFCGLGEWDGPCDIDVHWPNGLQHTLHQVQVDRQHLIREP
ncbi:MAG: CRTAC1 family protein [Planctomycetales bacterium]|nr:CRTAC1 family protein [Planctomycetales bacterium]